MALERSHFSCFRFPVIYGLFEAIDIFNEKNTKYIVTRYGVYEKKMMIELTFNFDKRIFRKESSRLWKIIYRMLQRNISHRFLI